MREHLADRRRADVDKLVRRLEQGGREGDVRPGVDAEAVAAYCTAVLQGMSVRAPDGATQAERERTAELATASWELVTVGLTPRHHGFRPPARPTCAHVCAVRHVAHAVPAEWGARPTTRRWRRRHGLRRIFAEASHLLRRAFGERR
ncbi:hypothetical protein ACF08N_05960 [Streptomyces sp. NPDC015127]|uniref:hypothetical protein n=1 Tax=Streptomyces sp. NPDC015127 TaxID=3364939 RepID=UPI0036FFACD7